MENTFELIRTRRSTRKYKTEDIPEDQLSQIVEAGRFAPSGGNCQSTHFIVVKNKEILTELSDLVRQEFAGMEIAPGLYKSIVNSINLSKTGNYVFHYNAPVLIITANQKDYGNNIADCACALENMMLMANALDLGSCWINQLKWLNENPIILEYMKKLGMNEGERVYGALAVGYPDTADGLPDREPLKRVGNKVTTIDSQMVSPLKENKIIGALIGLVGACNNNSKTENTDRIVVKALAFSSAHPKADETAIQALIEEIHAEKYSVAPGCADCHTPCGSTSDYDMNRIYGAEADIRELKLTMLLSLKELAADICGHQMLDALPEESMEIFYKVLTYIGFDMNSDSLLTFWNEVQEIIANIERK